MKNRGDILVMLTILTACVILLSCLMIFLPQKGEKQEEKKMEAIILLQGKFIRCEVERLEDFGTGGAKITSKDGTTYYTNNYTIIEE